MTTEELNKIVAEVMAQIEANALDFDIMVSEAQDNDFLTVARYNESDGTYRGLVITWKDVAKVVTDVAVQAKTDAVSAKDIAQQILTDVQNKGTEITNFVAMSKSEIETQKNQAVEIVRGVYRDDLNAVKQELDDKKITKFYASSQGNTSLPDSDDGKPTDMKIYGKSVQDGIPTPEAPVEIQSVVNPVVKMFSKNLFNYNAWKGCSVTRGTAVYENNGVTLTALENDAYTDFETGYSTEAQIPIRKGQTITLSWEVNDDADGIVYIFPNGMMTGLVAVNCRNRKLSYTATEGITFVKIRVGVTYVGKTISYKNIQVELGSTVTDFVPYKGESVSLPYTLNAVPVSDGGNVTIDGQQYIADYVDVENKKLIRMVGEFDLGTIYWEKRDNGSFEKKIVYGLSDNLSKYFGSICTKYKKSDWFNITANIEDNIFTIYKHESWSYINLVIRDNKYTDANTFKQAMNGVKLIYELYTPTEIDLTTEQIEAFKALSTYYPVTNVSVTSDQVDGYTVFNYPLNMKNGWDYVMQQIGETRPIIYDTQVKTIENIIDTAILTAMMEA